jgi:hypothetical protein
MIKRFPFLNAGYVSELLATTTSLTTSIPTRCVPIGGIASLYNTSSTLYQAINYPTVARIYNISKIVDANFFPAVQHRVTRVERENVDSRKVGQKF